MNTLKDLPQVTRILLVANVAIFGLSWLLPQLKDLLALHYFDSPLFEPYQLMTHIFMHASITHIFFNMYALVMFGSVIEKELGTQRFIILYFVSAIGALLLHTGIVWYQFSDIDYEILELLKTEGAAVIAEGKNYSDTYLGGLNAQFNVGMVGASGAIMGLFISFGIMYPNARLQVMFIPISIEAKYFMPVYMLIELFLGIGNFEWDNIAHFAHLGGAILGGILMIFFKKSKSYFE